MNRRLMWTGSGVALCAAVLVTTLTLSPAHEPTGAQIVVPLEEDPTPGTPNPPSSTVSVLLPAPPVTPPASTTPPATSQAPKPPAPLPKPAVTTPFRFGGLDLQAEIARIRNGRVEAEHSGFTGLGYVNYDAVAGSSVEWSVTAPGPASPDVVLRFANGSAQTRPMAISVNGTLVRTVGFPPTGAWNRWQTLTVHMDLPVGTNTIRATATTGDGGPNLDKITLV